MSIFKINFSSLKLILCKIFPRTYFHICYLTLNFVSLSFHCTHFSWHLHNTNPRTYFSCIFKYLFLSLLSTFHYFSKFFSHTFISLTFCICFFLEPLNYFLFSYLFLNLIYFIVTFHVHCTNYSLQWSFLAHNFAFIYNFFAVISLAVVSVKYLSSHLFSPPFPVHTT